MKFKIKKKSFLPAQLQWWELENFIRLLVGGYGSGKTYIGAMRAIYLSYLNSGLPGMYVSPTYRLAKRTFELTLREMLNRSGIEYVHNKTDHEFNIKNWNGVIWVGSGDDPDSLRGPNLAWAGIDEPFIQSREVFDQMIARVRHKEAKRSELFLTGTPEELNWGYQIANDPNLDIGIVTASTKDNYYNPKEYLNNLLSAYSKEQIEAYVEGKFVNLTKGRVYKDFNRELVVEKEVKGEVSAGIDFNVDAMTAELFILGSNWIHFFDEIRLRNSGTYDLGEAIIEKHPGIKVYPDASGSARRSSSSLTDHDILRQLGFKVNSPRSNPPVKDRVNAVNRMLREKRMTVSPKCKELIIDLETNVWRNSDVDKRDLDRTHAADSAGYPVVWHFPIRNFKPISREW